MADKKEEPFWERVPLAIGYMLVFLIFGWWFFIIKKLWEIHKFNMEEEKKEKK